MGLAAIKDITPPDALADTAEKPPGRIDGIDTARGIAIALMIISHGVKGLVSFSQMPDWGIVPIHLITKFSSSLFIFVFGISLSLFFIPAVGSLNWKTKRKKLLIRSLEIMVWYKVLTWVQMFQIYPKKQILDTLMFQSFPDFVEILGFYAFILMWIPFFLPVWKELTPPIKIGLIALFAWTGNALTELYDFGTHTSIKAILVENKGDYTFGQLQRGSMVLFGLLIGDAIRSYSNRAKAMLPIGLGLIVMGVCSFGLFYYLASSKLVYHFYSIAQNVGKHPPQDIFITFSVGGALTILGFFLITQKYSSKIFYPFTVIGRSPLFSFNMHIILIFVFLRYIFDLRRKVDYETALGLAIGVFLITALLARLKQFLIKKKKKDVKKWSTEAS